MYGRFMTHSWESYLRRSPIYKTRGCLRHILKGTYKFTFRGYMSISQSPTSYWRSVLMLYAYSVKEDSVLEVLLTIQSLTFAVCTISLNIKKFTFFQQNICIFCTCLRKIFEVFPTQPSTTGFYNRGNKRLLRGTTWAVKYNRLRFVLKWLKHILWSCKLYHAFYVSHSS
jgi:hypothetical protein